MAALDLFIKNDVKDANSWGIQKAIAEAGNEWADLAPEEKKAPKGAAKAKELALKAIENENLFLGPAGTKGLVKTYALEVIARSEALDKLQGKDKGSNLIEYMNKVSAAVREQYKTKEEFAAAKKRAEEGKLTFDDFKKFQKIKTAVGEAAFKHLGQRTADGKPLTVEDDFLQMLTDDSKKPEQDRKFKETDVKAPQPSAKRGGGGLLGLLIMLLIAILGGGDIGSLFGGLFGQSEEAEKKPVSFNPDFTKAKDAAKVMQQLEGVGKDLLKKIIPGGELLGQLTGGLLGGAPKVDDKGVPVAPAPRVR